MPRPRKQVENTHGLLDEKEPSLLSNRIAGWRIRVGGPWGMVHLVSSTLPVVIYSSSGKPQGIAATEIPGYGDEVGYLDWSQASAITWRYSDSIPPNTQEGPDA